jgi:hypothetical protein
MHSSLLLVSRLLPFVSRGTINVPVVSTSSGELHGAVVDGGSYAFSHPYATFPDAMIAVNSFKGVVSILDYEDRITHMNLCYFSALCPTSNGRIALGATCRIRIYRCPECHSFWPLLPAAVQQFVLRVFIQRSAPRVRKRRLPVLVSYFFCTNRALNLFIYCQKCMGTSERD